MKKMFVFATCLFLLYGVVVAATPPQAPTSARTQTHIEVTHLLEFVQDADCQFDRNGT